MKFATWALVMAACASAISISDAKEKTEEETRKQQMARAKRGVEQFVAVDQNKDGIASKDEILAYAKSKGLNDESAKLQARTYSDNYSKAKDGNIYWLELKEITGMDKLDLSDVIPDYLKAIEAAAV